MKLAVLTIYHMLRVWTIKRSDIKVIRSHLKVIGISE